MSSSSNPSPSLERLREKYRRYCARLGRPAAELPTTPQHDGSPHVEIVQGRYHYVITERGREWERRITDDEDELLFWLLWNLAFEMAVAYELQHRVPGQDFRRVLFAHLETLMTRVNPRWAQRTRQAIRAILQAHPYRDQEDGSAPSSASPRENEPPS